MNKWGIGLLIVNLLAAAGLTYYASEDRARRQAINQAVIRHYLALGGLPVDGSKVSGDSVDLRIPTANGVPVERVSLKLLQSYLDAPGGNRFGASGDPVASQAGEVERVVQAVNTAVSGMNTPKEKLDFLVGTFASPGGRRTFTPGLLVYLAESAEERDAARDLAKNAAGPTAGTDAGKAVALFAAKAAAVTAPGPDALRRRRIAQFLIGLEPTSDDWQKRVALVVGLRTYLAAVAEQDLTFQEIAGRVARRIEDDQAAFVSQYQLLLELSIQRSLVLSRQEEVKNELDQQQQKDAEILAMKTTQKAKSAKVHEDLRKDVAAQSAANAVLETAIHSTQRTVGRLLDEMLRLEAELDTAEQQRSRGR